MGIIEHDGGRAKKVEQEPYKPSLEVDNAKDVRDLKMELLLKNAKIQHLTETNERLYNIITTSIMNDHQMSEAHMIIRYVESSLDRFEENNIQSLESIRSKIKKYFAKYI